MNITFIGAGYVGLVSGAMMSHFGHNVTCIDTDQDKISRLKQGISPIFEKNLETYLIQGLKSGNLRFTDKYDESLKESSAIFISVGTPSLESGESDLSYIFEAINNISKFAKDNCLLVIKSTVPPGTCKMIKEYLKSKNLAYNVTSNPEFLKQGDAVEDFLNPDRIIIGTESAKDLQILEEIYKPFVSRNIKLVRTDITTSELIKYASNAFLAIKVAFINEMADLCETTKANIDQLSLGIGLDNRIGEKFLKAGPGFGGSCFPKDILALSKLAQKHKTESLILNAAINANNFRSHSIVRKIRIALGGVLSSKTITVLGLTYKAGTDDLRSSPAINLISILKSEGTRVIAYDPKGMDKAKILFSDLACANSATDACNNTDAIIIATEWEEFKQLDFSLIGKKMKSPIVIDLRNILDKELLKQKGFKYYSIGNWNDC